MRGWCEWILGISGEVLRCEIHFRQSERHDSWETLFHRGESPRQRAGETLGGQEIHDSMRFFMSDHPKLLFKSGNLHDEDYPCFVAFTRILLTSRKSSQQKFLIWEIASDRECCPAHKIKASDVLEKLHPRDPPNCQDCVDGKDQEKLLKNVLKGRERKSAMLHNNALTTEDTLNSFEWRIFTSHWKTIVVE